MAKNTSILSGGFLQGKKTYITALVGILSAVGMYAVGDMYLQELLQTALPLLAVIFLRKGIADK